MFTFDKPGDTVGDYTTIKEGRSLALSQAMEETAGACLKFVSDTLDTLEKTYRKEFLSLVGLIVGIKCVNALIRVT